MKYRHGVGWFVFCLCLAVTLGCDDDTASNTDGGPADSGAIGDAAAIDAGAADAVATDTASADAASSDAASSDAASSDAALPDPPAPTCTPPIALYDISSPTTTVGSGDPASCTEAALRSAVTQGGVITFDCGPAPATIQITETLELQVDRDTIIDGEHRITLDAGGATRHFYFNHPDWMNNPSIVALQRLTFIGGHAPSGTYYPQDPGNPDCAYGYKEGSGGVIYMRNGVLHIIDSEFYGNLAALEGPDVGGGAIYVVGVPEVIISGSRFVGNRAANGGAVGMLFANPKIYNSLFEDNTAEGVGMNYVEPGCPNFNHDEQGGAGGNSGAVYFDGLNDEGWTYTICGSVFRGNRANELGGALFRTPNAGVRDLEIDRCLFDGNTGRMGGVSFIKQCRVTVRDTTFMNNRSGVNVAGEEIGGPLGGLWINQGELDLENSTFYNNRPTGLNVEGGSNTVTNATFVESLPSGDLEVRNSLFVDTTCSSTHGGADNLQWPSGQACAAGTTFADPGIGDIGDHGGPTPTFLPAAGGPAVGVGSGCPETDQRGETRSVDSCAAGAVEP